MPKWMIDCIEEAPDVCKKMLKEKHAVIKEIKELYTKKKYKKLLLIGSGSSYNIAMSAKYALETFLKVKAEVLTPFAFINYDCLYHEDTFVICMSQSGRSTNTIAAIQKAKACGYDCAALTMMPDSPLDHYCEQTLEYGSYTGEADCFVCRYFSSSVLYFILFALEAGLESGTLRQEEYKQKSKELKEVVEYLPTAYKAVRSFYEANKDDFYSMKRAMAVGIGPTFGLTNEACLKMSETTGISTNGYELEEFLHGPIYEVKKDTAVFLLDGDPLVHDRTIAICNAAHEVTDRVYLITYSNDIQGRKTLNLPLDVDPLFRPLLYVIAFQYIPGQMCEDLGIRAITIYNYRASCIAETKTDH